MRAQAALGGPSLRKLIALELTADQRRAADFSYDACFAIVGRPGAGKSTALTQRCHRARQLHPDAEALSLAPGSLFDEFAASLLRSQGMAVTIVDDGEAELLFARVCEPLFSLEWQEFADDGLDPEVPGLRSPRRFLSSAFRLIRRLRDSGVAPAEFLTRALTGAAEFYAHPPNFGDPSLLSATKASYHDSLDAGREELERQRRRELDLAKILAKLYEGYERMVGTTGQMTGRDAVVAATRLLRQDPALANGLRERHRFAFVDDAQDVTGAELQLLSVLFGDALVGVTLCGDPSSAISSNRLTQPAATLARASARVELRGERLPQVEVARLGTQLEEAALVAERVAAWIDDGIRPDRIAVIFRSVRSVAVYETALLDRNVPATVAGDVNLFEDRRALDALALLWNVFDPFRHDWLLRTLANRALGLSDASLAILCSEPVDPQRRLFAFDDEPAPTARVSRWDPKRDLRLGWNVIRGERDDALSAEAAARVRRFRRLRERWLRELRRQPFETFVRTVWRDGLAREGPPHSAHARAQQHVLRRLLSRLSDFRRHHPDAGVGDLLEYAQERMESDLEACAPLTEGDEFVQLLSVEAARGREFDRVVVANVRPGAFPRWYSTEAFLFSPRLGMIPKENAGDARASRTAKFSYYMFRTKAAQGYNQRERRAFDYALRRARDRVLVTASGVPTRGITAPELLEELR